MLIACLAGVLAAQQEAVPEGTRPDPAKEIPPLMEAGNASYLRGDYEPARQSFGQAWDLAQQTPAENPLRYDILKRLTSVRAAVGEFADADRYLQLAINWRETAIDRNDSGITDDLLISAALCRGMKNYERARAILLRVLTVHQAAQGEESRAVADDYSRMAQTYLDEKKLEQGAGYLKIALEIRTKVANSLDASLVPDLDRLGSTLIAMRAYDQAEDIYRRALVIRETLLGSDDADLITSVDGLAYSLFGQKKYDQAEPLYQRLIGLWVKSVGDDHPMVATAMDKVAIFYAEQKKFDKSKEASDRATAIRAHSLASSLVGQAMEQVAEGDAERAVQLLDRALKVMDPPNPMYDELREAAGKLAVSLAPKKLAKKK